MKKSNTKIIIIVSILVCLVLIGTAVTSLTMAKFVTNGTSKDGARVAKWGMELTAGSDLSESYGQITEGSESISIIHSSSAGKDVLAPGTRGCLLWFNVSGNPEVAYNIDFEGTFSLGDGYKASERFVRDENDIAIEYFPINITLNTIDVTTDSNGEKSYDKKTVKTYSSYSSIETLSNDVNAAIKAELDSDNEPTQKIDRIYTVEWDWPYEAPDGNTYQTNARDTSLCEAIVGNKENGVFDVKLSMSLKVSQIN